ncbi:hypothetical protein [Sphingomonas jatrophae]|uniref:Uncharacterized protein n=1 Tax=Sphingomonas jatrophae TaxID=1166337 RepID=A0A1I6MAF2_9SPHN|nr:hypothetical protein [Sphingomonas jatrophae]SFS12704.1 hypothetical protein SAMN05192580_3794 [Sphingomonas jatrophae]
MARRDEEFPVDLPGHTVLGGHPLRWASGAIATATLFLAATNAVAIDGWAAELEPTPAVARLNAATAWWRAATDRVGLGAPRAALHTEWKKAEAAHLPGQAAAEE